MCNMMQPVTYKDIIYGSKSAAKLVDNIVTNKLPFPAYGKNGLLIYGPNGTGKSTLARLLPDAMEMARSGQPSYAPTKHVVQTGNNGTSLIASLTNIAQNVPIGVNHQFIILDEVDNLGMASMKSLKSVMDAPFGVLIMTTNNVGQIERGVLSRSHLIDMTVPPATEWLARCRSALTALGCVALPDDNKLLPLIQACHGDAREIMSEMHQLAQLL